MNTSNIISHVVDDKEDKEDKQEKEKVYSFLSDQALFKPTKIQYILDDRQNTYNVLLIGPIGAGKSRLINTIFNRKFVKSKASIDNATKEIYYIRAKKSTNEILRNYNELILADTIDLCENEWKSDVLLNDF